MSLVVGRVGALVVGVYFGIGRGGCMVGGWRRTGVGSEVEERHFVAADVVDEKRGFALPVCVGEQRAGRTRGVEVPVQAPRGWHVHVSKLVLRAIIQEDTHGGSASGL